MERPTFGVTASKAPDTLVNTAGTGTRTFHICCRCSPTSSLSVLISLLSSRAAAGTTESASAAWTAPRRGAALLFLLGYFCDFP